MPPELLKKGIAMSDKDNPVQTAELPCQNCGKLVMVAIPFYGCIFCDECMKFQSYETADASEFKERYSYE